LTTSAESATGADEPVAGAPPAPFLQSGDVTAVAGRGVHRHVATVEIHRPPANYFDEQLVSDLAGTLEAIDGEAEYRAVVLCAEGRHFCAGADFAGASRHSVGSIESLYAQALRLFATALPIVAAVQGAAIGGGLGLALAADFRVASATTRFSANFAKIGFHHGFAITVTLPAVVGQQAALDMLLTGRRVPGEEALALGLCDRLVPDEQIVTEAQDLAAEIAACGPLAVRAIRRTLRGELVSRAGEAMRAERIEQERLAGSTDFSEGVRANAERRPPEFTGQ
jgi:enoyl-CoA hydratase/carnithine racemase